MLSVSRGTRATAKAAFEHYTLVLRLGSVGVWSVSVGECTTLALAVLARPITTPPEDDSHCVIDFSACTPSLVSKHATLLARFAHERGCQYAAAATQ